MAAWTISVLEDVHEDFCSLQLISTKDPHKIHANRTLTQTPSSAPSQGE